MLLPEYTVDQPVLYFRHTTTLYDITNYPYFFDDIQYMDYHLLLVMLPSCCAHVTEYRDASRLTRPVRLLLSSDPVAFHGF